MQTILVDLQPLLNVPGLLTHSQVDHVMVLGFKELKQPGL